MEDEEGIILYPYVKSKKKLLKTFVFDFDETLGSFGHLFYLWSSLEDTPILLKDLMNIYPEFLRYGILVILEFLYFKKLQGKCHKIFVYTNNRCSIKWVNMIIEYITQKIPIIKEDVPLFDKIIYAFKINNKIVELNRTTYKKTYTDLINCTVIPKNTEICFIDDNYHAEMIHKKIYYIQPRAYYHGLTRDEILCRLFEHFDLNKEKNEITSQFLKETQEVYKTERENQIDISVSRKMMYYIKEFFYVVDSSNKTKKNNMKWGKFTRRRLK